jgi:hypothetical protein
MLGPIAITMPSVTISFNLAKLSVGAIDSFAAIVVRVEQLGP